MPINLKVKSASVEDLGHIVKQMIKGALEDREQLWKLHQAVYEDWYFKKTAELRNCNEAKKDEGDCLLRGDKASKESEQFACDDSQGKKGEDIPNVFGTVALYQKSSSKIMDGQEPLLNESALSIATIDGRCNNSLISFYSQGMELDNMNKSDVIIHIPSTFYIPEITSLLRDVSHAAEVQELFGKKRNRPPATFMKFDCKNLNDASSVVNGKPIPHLRYTLNDTRMTNAKDINMIRMHALNQSSFNTWKQKKTLAYRQFLKQQRQGEEEEKQRELNAKNMKIEQRKKVYKNYVRPTPLKPKTWDKKNWMMKQASVEEARKRQLEEKCIMNEKAFKAWKRRKDRDANIRNTMMRMNPYANYQHPQQPAQMPPTFRQAVDDINFKSWLNQLDFVLHQKYLKERRYLVRSFYCQPKYYGNVAMCAR